MNTSPAVAVNHHADFPGFAGATGLVAGLTMLISGRSNARLAANLTRVSDTDRVVDIGCGPGSAIRAAAHRGARATGVDPAPVMLRLAKMLTHNQPRVNWLVGAAEDLPLPDNSATVMWSLATVHHWKDVTKGLAEVKRVLMSGGRFLVIERQVRPYATGLASHGWTGQQAQSFATQCHAAGFHAARVEERHRGRRGVWAVQARRP
jgi:ubiquinone/menaquinone biosynthesis C-methylase UbiE